MPTKTIHLLPGQANLLTDYENTTLAAIAGTGGGKTALGYWWLHSRMESMPGHTWLLAEPTYQMLAKIIINTSDPARPSLIDYFEQIGWHPNYKAVDHILETDKGQVYLSSADNPNSMQGAPVKGAWLDEPGLMRRLAYDTARQRTAMMGGQVLLTSTPYDLGWLKTEVADKNGRNNIHVESWKSIDRPGFPRDRYEAERRQLPPWRFAMLYDARFERPAGIIYHSFNEGTQVIPRFELPSNWFIYSGHDFGANNPAALFTAVDPSTGNRYRWKEYLPGPGLSAYQHVQEFKELTKGYNVIARYGGSHQETGFRDSYTSQGWPIIEPRVNPVEVQIDAVIAAHQLNKIFVFDDLENYLDEKRSFSRELDDQGEPTIKIKDEAKYHLMACERYTDINFVSETAENSRATSMRFG